jgi:hypothetical protein
MSTIKSPLGEDIRKLVVKEAFTAPTLRDGRVTLAVTRGTSAVAIRQIVAASPALYGG